MDSGASSHVSGDGLKNRTGPDSGPTTTAAGPVTAEGVGSVDTALGEMDGAKHLPSFPNLLSLG